MGRRYRENTVSMMKFQINPHAQMISKGPMSCATALTSTVATAAVMRKSREEEASRSIRDASINSLMVSIFSIMSYRDKTLKKLLL